MTLEELSLRVNVSSIADEDYNEEVQVMIIFNNRYYFCQSTRIDAYRRIQLDATPDAPSPCVKVKGYTLKQAYWAFWCDCCAVNRIGSYSCLSDKLL